MDRRRLIKVAAAYLAAVAIAGSALASGSAAAAGRVLIDPTTLTPPLKPFRVCYQLGPTVSCDTSGDVSYVQEVGDFGCGTIWEFGEDVSRSTRWYQDGLIVRRFIEEHSRGYWSLAADGSGTTVAFQRDFSWDEHFATPGDIDSAVRVVKGTTLRVPALGSELHESGWSIPDSEDQHGRFENDEQLIALLCPLLLG
jgi:hypothetical protein